jgi:hypothetical protein
MVMRFIHGQKFRSKIRHSSFSLIACLRLKIQSNGHKSTRTNGKHVSFCTFASLVEPYVWVKYEPNRSSTLEYVLSFVHESIEDLYECS